MCLEDIHDLFEVPVVPDGIMMLGVIFIQLNVAWGFQKCIILRGVKSSIRNLPILGGCPWSSRDSWGYWLGLWLLGSSSCNWMLPGLYRPPQGGTVSVFFTQGTNWAIQRAKPEGWVSLSWEWRKHWLTWPVVGGIAFFTITYTKHELHYPHVGPQAYPQVNPWDMPLGQHLGHVSNPT